MSRDITTDAVTAVESAHVRPLMFAMLDFDSGTLYLHDGIGTHTWGGHDWLGLGDFGGVDLIEEGERATPYAVQLRLSGIDSSIATEALGESYYLREVQLYIGFLDAGNVLVDDPDVIWSGRMDVMDIQAGTQSAIILTCESYLARMDRINGNLFSDSELQSNYSGDTFLTYLPRMQELKLIWAETRAGSMGNDRSISGRHGGIGGIPGGIYIGRPLWS